MRRPHLPALPLLICAMAIACAAGPPKHDLIKDPAPLTVEPLAAVDPAGFTAAEFTASDGTVLQYRLLTPSRAAPGARYPLVLQLHGSGGIGTDNLKHIDALAKTWATPDLRDRYQTYVLMPQFQVRSANYGPPTADQHAEHASALIAALELVEEFTRGDTVDPSRVYAVGFSMGGSAAWLAPTLRPTLFAAAVPISGVAPDNALAPIFKTLPTLVIHGDADTENPITADLRFVSEINRLGGQTVQLRQYQGLDHHLPQDIYPGYWWRDWLFEQHSR